MLPFGLPPVNTIARNAHRNAGCGGHGLGEELDLPGEEDPIAKD